MLSHTFSHFLKLSHTAFKTLNEKSNFSNESVIPGETRPRGPLHDVGVVGLFSHEPAGCRLHERVLALHGVAPHLVGEAEDAHRVPGDHLRLPQGVLKSTHRH